MSPAVRTAASRRPARVDRDEPYGPGGGARPLAGYDAGLAAPTRPDGGPEMAAGANTMRLAY